MILLNPKPVNFFQDETLSASWRIARINMRMTLFKGLIPTANMQDILLKPMLVFNYYKFIHYKKLSEFKQLQVIFSSRYFQLHSEILQYIHNVYHAKHYCREY